MVYLCDSSINASSHLTLNYYYSQLCLFLCQQKLIVALMEGNSGLCGTIAIWISRRNNTYDPRNHWLTSWWLFLPHSDCGFVSRMLVHTLWHLNEQTNLVLQRVVHGTIIEIVWTIFPSVNPMFIWESQKENFECILLFLFSAIEISILDILFQNFNFCFSSLLSYNPPHRTTFLPSCLPLRVFSYNASALDSKATRFMSCYQYHACIHFIFLETVHIFSALQLSYCDDRDSWHVIRACIMWSFCTDPIWKWQCVLFYYVVFGWFLFCMQALLSPTRLSSLPTVELLFASKLYKPLSMSACCWCLLAFLSVATSCG